MYSSCRSVNFLLRELRAEAVYDCSVGAADWWRRERWRRWVCWRRVAVDVGVVVVVVVVEVLG